MRDQCAVRVEKTEEERVYEEEQRAPEDNYKTIDPEPPSRKECKATVRLSCG